MLSEFPGGGHFFLFFAVWHEETGPKIQNVYPDSINRELDLLQLAGRCFLAGIGSFDISGGTIAESAAQFPLFTPSEYAYVFFGAWEDLTIRGGVRPFELAIVFKEQLHSFQEIYLMTIVKQHLKSFLANYTIDLTELYQDIFRRLGQLNWDNTADILKAFAGDLLQQSIFAAPDKKEDLVEIFDQTLLDYLKRFSGRN